MKVLVTGATGFLGKYVVEELAEQGYQVRAFGRNLKAGRQLEGPLVEFLLVILPEKKKFCSLRRSGCSGTCWCPLNDLGTLGAVYQTNVVGTKLVMEACRHFGVKRLVYISSPSVYACGA